MKQIDVASALSLMAELLEFKGENAFKVRAYQNAARAVQSLSASALEQLAREKRLTGLPGVGKGLAEAIAELLETGRLAPLEKLRQEVPTDLPDMLRIPGLGPKKIQQLHEVLGIDTLVELEYAIHENRLLELPGFGAKTQAKIQQGLHFVLANRGRCLLSDALPLAEALREAVASAVGCPVHFAGELRRQLAIIEEILLVIDAGSPAAPSHAGGNSAASPSPEAPAGRIYDRLEALFAGSNVDRVGGRLVVTREQGPRAVIEVAGPGALPTVLCIHTGSEAHVRRLQDRAAARGYTLSAGGLERDGVPVPLADEAALYQALGLEFIRPELREDRGEIEAAEAHALPALIAEPDLRGVFHVHTTWSDGSASLEDMAKAAGALGLEYVGISDHSKAAGYAGGLNEERLARQCDEIDAYNEAVAARGQGPWLFKGSEVDILADGQLDLDDSILDRLDFVIASVHSSFSQPGPEVTARVLRAVRHPKVTMLGHPTGRLLLGREGYAVDLEAVLQAAAECGTVMELNANPHRLDLAWPWLKRGRELGVRFAINPDAHSTSGLRDIRFGVGAACRGWLTADDVINTKDLAAMKAWLQARREERHV